MNNHEPKEARTEELMSAIEQDGKGTTWTTDPIYWEDMHKALDYEGKKPSETVLELADAISPGFYSPAVRLFNAIKESDISGRAEAWMMFSVAYAWGLKDGSLYSMKHGKGIDLEDIQQADAV